MSENRPYILPTFPKSEEEHDKEVNETWKKENELKAEKKEIEYCPRCGKELNGNN